MKINDDLSYLKHTLDLDLHISVLEHLLSYGHDKCIQEKFVEMKSIGLSKSLLFMNS